MWSQPLTSKSRPQQCIQRVLNSSVLKTDKTVKDIIFQSLYPLQHPNNPTEWQKKASGVERKCRFYTVRDVETLLFTKLVKQRDRKPLSHERKGKIMLSCSIFHCCLILDQDRWVTLNREYCRSSAQIINSVAPAPLKDGRRARRDHLLWLTLLLHQLAAVCGIAEEVGGGGWVTCRTDRCLVDSAGEVEMRLFKAHNQSSSFSP